MKLLNGGGRVLVNKIDLCCAKIQVLDKHKNILFDNYLLKTPLNNIVYEKEGKARFNSSSPCILQRKVIERDVCMKSVASLDKDKVYSKNEVKCLFDCYGFEGEYLVITY